MPTVFISYSWDGPEHRAWVLRFAEDLRANGVETWLDQWEIRLGDDVTEFMERGASLADHVLLICTEEFARKADSRSGGVGYEQSILTAQILNAASPRGRVVCLLRKGAPSLAIPRYMQARLWVDCRDDNTYPQALQQILKHVLDHNDLHAPVIARSVDAIASTAPVIASAAPRCWVLVAGTGRSREFSPELERVSRYLGEELRHKQCGLVTGGWPGVDNWVAHSFADSSLDTTAALEDALVQVVRKDQDLVFTAGQIVLVASDDDEWNEPIRRAGVVVLLGGVGGTRETGEAALRLKRPVLPIADTGGDAKEFYFRMLQDWESFEWMGVSQREFQQLGRPGISGVSAAADLAVRLGTKGSTD